MKRFLLLLMVCTALNSALHAMSGAPATAMKKDRSGQPIVDKPSLEPNLLLMESARTGDLDGTQEAIISGADVNYEDNIGVSPLIVAATNGHYAVAKFLIDLDADIDHQKNTGLTALIAAVEGDHRDVAELLLAKGADIHHKKRHGETALIMAAHRGNVEMAQFLIDNGARVNDASSNDSATPLFVVAQNGNLATAELLLRKGANVDATWRDGFTPLMMAAQNGHRDMAQLFINNNANIYAQRNVSNAQYFPNTARDYARMMGHNDIVQLLDEAGERKRLQSKVKAIPSKDMPLDENKPK